MKTLAPFLVLLFVAEAISQAVKEPCGASNACDADLVCETSVCKAKVGTTCTASSTDECVSGAECPAAAKCTCKTATPVPKGDNTACVLKADDTCAAGGTGCLDGATCVNLKCTCTDPLTASTDKMKCLTKVEGACTDDGECVYGATCQGADGSKKCNCTAPGIASSDKTKCQLKVDDDCTASGGASCPDGATCQNSKCACTAPAKASTDKTKCNSATVFMSSMILMVAALLTSRLM